MLNPTTVDQLVLLYRDRTIETLAFVQEHAAELGTGHDPVIYMDVVVLCADVLYDTLTATRSLQKLKDWAVAAAARDPVQYWNRMRVIFTAMKALNAHLPNSNRVELFALDIMGAAYRTHRIMPVDEVGGLELKPSKVLFIQMRGLEAAGC